MSDPEPTDDETDIVTKLSPRSVNETVSRGLKPADRETRTTQPQISLKQRSGEITHGYQENARGNKP